MQCEEKIYNVKKLFHRVNRQDEQICGISVLGGFFGRKFMLKHADMFLFYLKCFNDDKKNVSLMFVKYIYKKTIKRIFKYKFKSK